MKKGVLEMCILFQLSKAEMYGYELMKATKQLFPDVHEATIYSILRRLHSDGSTQTYIGSTSNGPQRKYYKITSLGKESLESSTTEWNAVLNAVRELGIPGE